MALHFPITRESFNDADSVLSAEITAERAVHTHDDKRECRGPHKFTILGLPYSRAVKAAELIQNTYLMHAYNFKHDLRFHPPLKSTNPWDRQPPGSMFLLDYKWEAQRRRFTFDLAGDAFDAVKMEKLQEQLRQLEPEIPAAAKDEESHTLYIVAGAARSIGHHYMQALKQTPAYCLGISRRDDGHEWLVDLLSEADMVHGNVADQKDEDFFHSMFSSAINRIPPGPLRIVLLYTIGPFQYQGHPAMGDDPKHPDTSMYSLNFTGFRDMAGIVEDIAEHRRSDSGDPVRVDLVGLSTKALMRDDSELFPAYSVTKSLMEKFVRNFSKKTTGGITRSGLVLRTSTLHTPSEGDMRFGADPADRQYWIEPRELVDATLDAMQSLPEHCYRCLDVYMTSFATRKLVQGHDHLTIATLMGHTDGSMLAKTYSHISEDIGHLQKALIEPQSWPEVGQ